MNTNSANFTNIIFKKKNYRGRQNNSPAHRRERNLDYVNAASLR